MQAVLLFGLALLATVLMSAYAHRSAFSSSLLFLAVGTVAGVAGWIPRSDGEMVRQFADAALFAVLFSDGMRSSARELRVHWKLPARALLVGLPLTLVALALLAHFAAGLAWDAALLIAAVLTPTDPVFAAALVQRDEVPNDLRRLLNVESGFNDGLALPLVLGLLTWMGADDKGPLQLLAEVTGGAAVGLAVPWIAQRLQGWSRTEVRDVYLPLFVMAVGILVYAIASLSGANQYIGGFCAGIAMRTWCPAPAEGFTPVGERIAELFKFAALLVFAALALPASLLQARPGSWVFAGGALVLARPLALALALAGTDLGWRERLVAGWFGPKGFASVVYGFLVLRSNLPSADELFQLAALVVTVSIVAHSTTDVPATHWLASSGRKR